MNSANALFVMAPFAVIDNNILINCGWGAPNGGRSTALCIGYNSDKQRRIIASSNLVRFNEDSLDEDLADKVSPSAWYGMYIQDTNAEIQLINNRAEGFHRFPEFKGIQRNENSFRDCMFPDRPPQDQRQPDRVISGNSFGDPDWQKEMPFR